MDKHLQDLIKVRDFLKTNPTDEQAAVVIREHLDTYEMDYKEFCVQLWDLEDQVDG